MKSAEPSYHPPPPGYSLPGQQPPKDNHHYPSAPPPPGLHASPQAPQNQTIILTTMQSQFSPYPMRATCPNCRADVMTETRSAAGLLTYILSGALCLLAPYCLCCFVPYCVRECKDIEHSCPNCNYKLGLFKRI